MVKRMIDSGVLDKLGMAASGLCGIHCLILPIVFVLFPYASVAFVKGEFFEWSFLLFSITIASFAMVQGLLVHRKLIPLAVALLGFMLFIWTRTVNHDVHETFSGSLMLVLAGALICGAHYLNHKFIKNHKCACSH